MSVSFVDVARRPPAPGELRRFVDRHGARALLDETSRAYADAHLGHIVLTEEDVLRRLQADPRLLRLPLVRRGGDLTVGVDEEAWRRWQRGG